MQTPAPCIALSPRPAQRPLPDIFGECRGAWLSRRAPVRPLQGLSHSLRVLPLRMIFIFCGFCFNLLRSFNLQKASYMPRYDPLSASERSKRMSLVRGSDTKPEYIVRKLVYSMGYRYRLHAKDLPGKPDLVFRGRKKVIFVHGCFWHQHGCRHYRQPRTRESFWLPKLEANVRRDRENIRQLRNMGWRSLFVWECQLNKGGLKRTASRIKRFLEG